MCLGPCSDVVVNGFVMFCGQIFPWAFFHIHVWHIHVPPAPYLGRFPKLPQVEAGGLERSYRRAPKHAGDKGKAPKIEKDPAGICHLCRAGLKGFDWEDVWTAFVFIIPFVRPCFFQVVCIFAPGGIWISKVFFSWTKPGLLTRTAGENMIKLSYVEPIEPPWVVEPSWTKFPLQNLGTNGKARFFRPDIWHTIQMGVGKDFASSALSLLVREIPESSIDDRFAVISNEYISWCRRFHKTRYVNKLDKRMIGGGGLKDEPYGTWNKAALTVTLLEFLQFYCGENKEWLLAHEDTRYRFLLKATMAINDFMSSLYHQDLWVPKAEANRIATKGTTFVKCFVYLAYLSANKGQPMFAIKPKLHMLHECALALQIQAGQSSHAFNPLSESCSLDEDFVGRLAFISRSVSPRLISQRSIERYMVQAFLSWTQVGKD